jgi:sec-independent protein translocase protein TatC
MPPPEYDEDDLFRDSTMTFGEHLEELRVCLYRAVLWLIGGFVIGLFAGGWVVAQIQGPLVKALTRHYQHQLKQKVESGEYALPGDPEQFVALIEEDRLLAKQYYVNAEDMLRELKEAYPKEFEPIELPSTASDQPIRKKDLIPVYLWLPLEDDARIRPKSLSAHEAFLIYIKAAFVVGLILASPMVFYHIWSFVAAGLYPHEKRYIHVYLPFSVLLFLAGAALAFFFVFEPVLNFLFGFNRWLGIDPDPRISEWLGFVLLLPIGFGIAFQLPLVMLFLERIQMFTVESYLSQWRMAVLVIALISMLLTPADPYSMLLMGIPLTILYFGGVLLCRLMPRLRSPFDEPVD